MNKQVALRIPDTLYNEIVKELPRTVSVNNRIIELIQLGLSKETKVDNQSLKVLLNAIVMKYKKLGGSFDS